MKKIKSWTEKGNISPKVMFILLGLISTLWFLIRVIPKPSRAFYPCMRFTAPVMSGFVIYLLSLGALTVTLKKLVQSISRSRFLVSLSLLCPAVIFILMCILNDPSVSEANESSYTGPEDGPNLPIGTACGINPGRVIWAWDPESTNENCKNVIENYDWFFNPANADQTVISRMVSESINKLTGEQDLKQAWDALFRYHNLKKYNKEKGHSKGEKIFIKINQGTASWVINREEKARGYYLPRSVKPGQERRFRGMGATETSPYIVLEVLRELVNEAGIDQNDIYIGDPQTHVFGHNYDVWHAEFPDIHYIDRTSDIHGRTLIKQTAKDLLYYSDKKFTDKSYDVIENADYMINVASLKPHGSAGISLTAKNHFGSQGRPSAAHLHYSNIAPSWEVFPREVGNPSNGGYRKYRVMVDIMGSRYLGRNTMLYIVDGLFGGGADETRGPVKYFMEPFNYDWSSSIFMSQDQVALESVCYDFLRTEWNGKNKHDQANNTFESGPNMPGVDDYLHQAADRKNWPEGLIYDPDNSGKSLPSLGVHEHWNNGKDKQYSGNMGIDGGITLISIPDSLVKNPM